MSARRKESTNGFRDQEHDSDTVLTHVYLPKTVDTDVSRLARVKQKTKNEVIRELIKEGVKQKGK